MSKSSLVVRLLAVLAVLFAPGCATLIHGGGQQTVSIATDPPGAKIQVGGQSLVSPAEITLSRDHDYQVVVTSDGYDTAITSIHSRFSWVTVLDLIFIIPWVIDLASGSAYYLDPEAVQLVMSPANPQRRSVGSSDYPSPVAAPAPMRAPNNAAAAAASDQPRGSVPGNPNVGDQWKSSEHGE
jgi:hypothetical protein